jgi:hypothetical protein
VQTRAGTRLRHHVSDYRGQHERDRGERSLQRRPEFCRLKEVWMHGEHCGRERSHAVEPARGVLGRRREHVHDAGQYAATAGERRVQWIAIASHAQRHTLRHTSSSSAQAITRWRGHRVVGWRAVHTEREGGREGVQVRGQWAVAGPAFGSNNWMKEIVCVSESVHDRREDERKRVRKR